MARWFENINWISDIYYNENNDNYGQLCGGRALYSGKSDCLVLYKTWRFTENRRKKRHKFWQKISCEGTFMYIMIVIFMYVTRVVYPDHRKRIFFQSVFNVYHVIAINHVLFCLLTNSLQDKIAKNRLWPVEVMRMPLPAGGKGKKVTKYCKLYHSHTLYQNSSVKIITYGTWKNLLNMIKLLPA